PPLAARTASGRICRKLSKMHAATATTASAINQRQIPTGSDAMQYHGAWFVTAITILTPLGPTPAGAETLAVFTKSAGNPIARAARAGADAMAKTHGFTVFHYIPTSADNVPQQTFLVE